MNLQNIKQKLDKINRFYAYLEANQEIISRVDRDALLASIRELYDACFEEGNTVVKEAPEVEPIQQTVTTTVSDNTPKPEPVVETPKKKRPKLVFNTTNTTPEATKPAKEEATVIKETPKEEVPKQEPVVSVEPVVEPTTATEETPTQPTNSFKEEFEELFLFKAATDLSQKLSAAPLKDLNKALGLNEKFLYINELFGGDVAKFQTAIKALNNGGDFEEARTYIESNLVEQYEWMKKLKKPVAKDFVKLIRRRYL
ncbi:hypothetical protein [Aureispira anguillae]|uniref:Uncharacterized protein n=1 Tax=Aureispira anguillae TaxID=2864201 RepID=A0A916DQT3_9BACT|nr:hypothetical protein [Aureispira anguillae]BDS09806.1 hypothetical protein AsAng_0005110 [Aureispira anguillae]